MTETAAGWLPEHQFGEHHEIVVHASPAAVERALRAVSLAELPLARALWALRRLPATLRRQSPEGRSSSPFLEEIPRQGGVILVDRPGRIVAGLGGQFWRLGGGIHRFRSPDEFSAWGAPESCKATLEFAWTDTTPVRLETTTLVHVPDDAARRSFSRYWRVVRPASGLIRILVLRAVKRRAESA